MKMMAANVDRNVMQNRSSTDMKQVAINLAILRFLSLMGNLLNLMLVLFTMFLNLMVNIIIPHKTNARTTRFNMTNLYLSQLEQSTCHVGTRQPVMLLKCPLQTSMLVADGDSNILDGCSSSTRCCWCGCLHAGTMSISTWRSLSSSSLSFCTCKVI